ncbi:MAG: redoxin family protein [Tepidisphaeraceae bacterium]|jgi:thiol-disulfide isomerase/thioredoxin
MFIKRTIAAVMTFGLLATVCAAAEMATLNVGDPAPRLQAARWVKGEPVKEFEKGKIYVVEFWASWCGPCRASIPHVSKLQEQYKDKGVIMIGQNCWEEKQDGVAAFVEEMGDKMNYRVALDELKGSDKGQMAESWMKAAGQDGIPTAFIVDKEGRIAWIGHPMEMDKVLEKIIAGTFDAKKEAEARKAIEQLGEKLGEAMNDEKWDKALDLIGEIVKANPDAAGDLLAMKFDVLMKKKDYDAAYKLGDKLLDKLKDEPEALNELAWSIATEEGIEKRDLDLAEKLAVRAVEASKGEDGAILDTLARVYFDKGQVDKAIEFQTKAVAKASEDLKEQVEATLVKYRQKKQTADK